jgi:hypothetical protein
MMHYLSVGAVPTRQKHKTVKQSVSDGTMMRANNTAIVQRR